ncbi:hypothetical protein OJAV_G00002270 [Oryzias javanicus]|uniref:Uncharacterized protein n=1 Tax=Oryzias javanicus TaxID=123683 RepID=A0A3S2PTG6_ORYJA|nr:hypothetical protein OJAV_G00002270 [Oryzias javanicus]
MAKGKTKISSRSENSAPPPARSLRSRKREPESSDVGQTANVQAPLLLKGTEEVRTAAKPLQECTVIVHQLNQTADQSCLTRPGEATKERPTDESEVSSLNTATPKSSSSSKENQAESWAGDYAIDDGSKRQQATAVMEIHRSTELMFTDQLQVSEVSEASSTSAERKVEGHQEQQESAPAVPAKKRRRMGSCGLTEGERSRILGNTESCMMDGQQQAELQQAELQQAGENGRAQTELPISSLYRAERDPDSESAPQLIQREHLREELQGAKGGFSERPEESSRHYAEEDAPPQTVNHAEEETTSAEASTTRQSFGSAQPPAEIPAEETRNGGTTDSPAAALGSGRDSHGARGCSDYVSDSQLNTIVFTEELMEDEYCLEDATELLCGIISELSSVNRRVMAAHRELENLRRSRKASRNSPH